MKMKNMEFSVAMNANDDGNNLVFGEQIKLQWYGINRSLMANASQEEEYERGGGGANKGRE